MTGQGDGNAASLVVLFLDVEQGVDLVLQGGSKIRFHIVAEQGQGDACQNDDDNKYGGMVDHEQAVRC